MADSLTEQVLRRLGINIPTAPEVSPEQQSLYREMATREQAKRPQWKRAISSGIEGAGNFLKGLGLSDPLTDTPQGWPEFGGMAIGVAGLPFGPKGIKGMFSRTEKVAESLPGSVHPNKLAAILKNRASQEEVQWRGIDKMLAEHGNKPVAKQEFVEHLEKNPLDVTVLERGPQQERWSIDALGAPNLQYEGTGTIYDNYQMPGAKNYRETLIQLPPKPDLPELQPETLNRLSRERFGRSWIELTPAEQNEGFPIFQQAARSPSPASQGVFQSHHWEDPNVLVHVRHNERDLPPKPSYSVQTQKSPSEYGGTYHEGIVKRDGSDQVASVWPRYSVGTPGSIPEIKGRADDLIHQMLAQALPSSKGRMLENVQSDWHQRGAHSGYTNSATPNIDRMRIDDAEVAARVAYQTRLQEAAKAIGEWHPDYADTPEDILRREDASFIWNRLAAEADNTGNPQLLQLQAQVRDAQTAYMNATDAARRISSDAVPDAPFKDSWPELALKQQLLDVADRPDLEWLGIAPSSELRNRGEVISPEFQDVQLLRTLEKLVKPFGGKVEQVPVLEKGQPFFNPQTSLHPSGLPSTEVHRYITGDDPNPSPVASVWPRSRDPKTQYNPDKDAGALIKQLTQNRPELLETEYVKAFIARLTPEMKAQIKEKGFPLLTLLAMMNAERSQEN